MMQSGNKVILPCVLLDAQNIPRLQLLYTTCCTGLDTITRLVEDFHQPQAIDACSRLRLWGAGLFNEIQLDELLDSHGFLRRHILGVLADIAAILESILSAFLSSSSEAPVSDVGLRRLRIALGQNDVSSILTDVDDTEAYFDNSSDWVKEQLDNLDGLIDCMYDSLFTISMTSKLERAKSQVTLVVPPEAVLISDEETSKPYVENESQKPSMACLRKSPDSCS